MEEVCVFCGEKAEYLAIYKLGHSGTIGLVVCEKHSKMALKPKKIRPLKMRAEVVGDDHKGQQDRK